MSRPPLFFERILLHGGPLDGANVLIGRGHSVLQVHSQIPYDDSKSDQPVEYHNYHYIRGAFIAKDGGSYTIFHYAPNLKTIPE